MRSLWHLGEFLNGRAFKPDEFSEDGLPVIRIRQLVDPSVEADRFDGHVDHKNIVENGDLIFSWSASLAVRMWDRGRAVLNQHLYKIVPEPGIDKRWLRWRLESLVDYFQALMHGSAMTHLTTEMLKQTRVEVPSLEEQRRIADFLDAETERIEQFVSRRNLQRELVQERLDALWAHKTLEMSGQATWIPLRRFVVAITDGPFGSGLTSGHYSDDGARVIRLGNVDRARFRTDDKAFIPLEYFYTLRQYEARAGDLVVAALGDQNHPLGRACVVPEGIGPAMVKADCYRLRLDQRCISHEYAAWMLSSPVISEYIRLLARGATRARINLDVVREVSLPVPSTKDQRRVTVELEGARTEASAVREHCEAQLALLGERRQALITAAVTGQLDVITAQPGVG